MGSHIDQLAEDLAGKLGGGGRFRCDGQSFLSVSEGIDYGLNQSLLVDLLPVSTQSKLHRLIRKRIGEVYRGDVQLLGDLAHQRLHPDPARLGQRQGRGGMLAAVSKAQPEQTQHVEGLAVLGG